MTAELQPGQTELLYVCMTFVVLSEAVAPQQEHSVGWRHVQVNVLEVEQNGKQQCPLQVLSLHNAHKKKNV